MITQRWPDVIVTTTPFAVLTGPTENPFTPALTVALEVMLTFSAKIELLPIPVLPPPPEEALEIHAVPLEVSTFPLVPGATKTTCEVLFPSTT
jgi:hypothetical protein